MIEKDESLWRKFEDYAEANCDFSQVNLDNEEETLDFALKVYLSFIANDPFFPKNSDSVLVSEKFLLDNTSRMVVSIVLAYFLKDGIMIRDEKSPNGLSVTKKGKNHLSQYK